MPTYSLIFSHDGIGEAQRIEFNATNASAALSPAIYSTPGRVAELWDDKKKLAKLKSWEPGFWEIVEH